MERLLQAIRLGVVGPGERLPPERELAARLGISRVTLREAFRVLRQSGYVESSRGRYGGTFVAREIPRPPRRNLEQMGHTIEDVLILRDVLEPGTAEAAARRPLSGAEQQRLRQRLNDTAAASLEDYRRYDSRLHLAIAEAAGSPSLTSAVADLRTRLNELLDAIPLLSPNIGHSNEQHAAIVTAVLARDPENARRAMAEHVDGTASLLRGFLRLQTAGLPCGPDDREEPDAGEHGAMGYRRDARSVGRRGGAGVPGRGDRGDRYPALG